MKKIKYTVRFTGEKLATINCEMTLSEMRAFKKKMYPLKFKSEIQRKGKWYVIN